MAPSSTAKTDRAVVLLQLGGPDSLEAVQPFLYNLFADPDIIDLPGAFMFRTALARRISKSRAPKVRSLYGRIGGRSPILEQTQQQADSLREYLVSRGSNVQVEIAMRYWHPMTDAAVKKILANKVKEVVLLPLYPHYSKATTGSSFNEWDRVARTLGADTIPTRRIQHYFDHPLYIRALVERIREGLERFSPDERSNVHLLFSAHGTPLKLVQDGDPYSRHIQKTYEQVLAQGKFGLQHHLCYQSKVGPQKWLEPSLTKAIRDLGGSGVKHVLVTPVAFVTDHIETLSEINIEGRELAESVGIRQFEMTAPLLTNRSFVECLGELVLQEFQD
ncbi:MAG TPA: ferrochelatase [Bacteroidota bacterium]|nr:ferrochelatase [Bacteroidota bacterium]